MKAGIRVVVVEDFEAFRKVICCAIRAALPDPLICEALDGLQGVALAEQLQPDLIILDIGLPRMNGLEAARRIRALSPQSKVIFVTQESSADVLKEAFGIGATGFVVKTDAGTELSPAILAVLRNEKYVSRSADCPSDE
jgi:DNA-binding NarL/FixJ family response regulator